MINFQLVQIAVIIVLIAAAILILIREMSKKKPNAIIWRHPSRIQEKAERAGSSVDFDIVNLPRAHSPYKYPYALFGLMKTDVWAWYEERVETPKEREPEYYKCSCGWTPPETSKDPRASLFSHIAGKKNSEKKREKEHTPVALQSSTPPELEVTYVLKPYVITPTQLRAPQPKSDRERPRALITSPSELWDETDWSCASRFGATHSKLKEAIKLGVGLGMFAICAVALIMIIDMVQNPKTNQPIATSTPAAMLLERGDEPW